MEVAEELARNYQRGIAYLDAARRITLVLKKLDERDAAELRRFTDRLTAKGLGLLTSAVKMKKARSAPEPANNSNTPEITV